LRTLQYAIAATISAAACGAAFCAAALLAVMVIVNVIARPIQRRASVTDTVAVQLCHERAGTFEEPWDIGADMELATVSAFQMGSHISLHHFPAPGGTGKTMIIAPLQKLK